jgi:OFA family oxalate/formate antiporter-like MFS transporter
MAFLIGHGISSMMSGRLVDRYSPRPILFVSALLAGFGVSMCSQVESITQLRVFLLIGGFGAGATWAVPNSSVQRWFQGKPRAGLALGLVSSGVGIGGLIFAPFINYLIMRFGWRNAYLIVGILFFLVITISSILVKTAPAETQKTPDTPDTQVKPLHTETRKRRLLADPTFLGIAFTHCVGAFAFQTLSVHLMPYATDVAIPATLAAAALGLMGGWSVPARIVSGFLADWIGWQKIMAFSIFGMAFSIL